MLYFCTSVSLFNQLYLSLEQFSLYKNFPIVLHIELMSSNIEIVTEHTEKGVYIAQFKAKFISIFAYYVESQGECYLIDPTYDHIAYKDFIAKRGSTLKYVLLTHYHADFIGAHTEFKVPVIMGPGAKR